VRVQDVMHVGAALPVVGSDAVFREVLEEMNAKGRGAVCVTGADGVLLGLVTDGDIRRLILSTQKTLPELFMEDVSRVMHADPTVLAPDATLEDAAAVLERLEVWVLPVVEAGKLVGLLHMHPLLKAMLEAGR